MIFRSRINERGYTLAGALTLLSVMAILMAMSLPLWSRVKQRDNEEELIFRGNQYIKAISRYHAKFGTYPPDLETLEKLKFVRKQYLDPMTESGKWKLLHPESLLQTGAAGTINTPGAGNKQGADQKRTGGGLDRDEEEDDREEDLQPGLSEEDDDDSDEEPELESRGPVVGVVSRSKKASIKIYNGQSTYNKWAFVYALPQQQQRQQVPPGGTPQPGGVPQAAPRPGSGGTRPQPPQPQQPPAEDDDNGDWEKE